MITYMYLCYYRISGVLRKQTVFIDSVKDIVGRGYQRHIL